LIWPLVARLRLFLDAVRPVRLPLPAGGDRVRLSVLMPVYAVPSRYLRDAISSVVRNLGPRDELILVDDASPGTAVGRVLAAVTDPRVRVLRRGENGHICRATNEALEWAQGEFCAFVDCDDLLEAGALALVAEAIARRPEVDVWYSDERQVFANGWLGKAVFHKPGWSPETLLSLMYCGHLTVVRTGLLRSVGGLRVGTEGAQDHDLLLRLDEAGAVIDHLPWPLYRWRARKGSTARRARQKDWALDAGRRVRQEALDRRGGGTLVAVPECHQWVARFAFPASVRVLVVVPTRDHPEVLGRFLASLGRVDPGCPYDLVVVDNGSQPPAAAVNRELAAQAGGALLWDDRPFNFSALNNRAAGVRAADVLVFCNDDLEALEAGWLATLVGQCLQPGVGAVGTKLLYPGSNRIQHAGVVLLEQGPAHLLHGRPDHRIYQYGWTKLAWNVSAVTGACLAVTHDRFTAVGGWDEAFPVAYNDVDLCLRLSRAGFRNVVRNDISLLHHESASRGLDRTDPDRRSRQAADLERLKARHAGACGPDPSYPAAFHQRRSDFAPRDLP